MDEADALAARIGIMAAGRMRVLGSPQHLKARHGGGYRVELKPAADSESAAFEAAMSQLVQEHFSEAKRVQSHQGTLLFEVDNRFALARVFGAFEGAKATHGLETFTMSQTSLEDVFLRVAETYNQDTKHQAFQGTTAGRMERAADATVQLTAGVHAAEIRRYYTAPDSETRVQAGYYLNKCLNVWVKITPDSLVQQGSTAAAPAGYSEQCYCFMLEWLVPVPCCCCPEEHLTLQPPDVERPASDEGAEIYTNASGKTTHVWREHGKYERKGPCDSDTFTRWR